MSNSRQQSTGKYEIWSGASSHPSEYKDWDIYSTELDEIVTSVSTAQAIRMVGREVFEADKPFDKIDWDAQWE